MNIHDTLHYLTFGLPEDIRRKKEFGDYDGAIRLIDRRLEDPATPEALAHSLRLQKRICSLLPGEFPYTRKDALAIIREKIPEFTDAEFDEYVDARRIRWIYVNGQEHYFNRFFSSLCKAAPGFAQRAGVTLPGVESATSGSQGDSRLDISMKKMMEKGSMTNRIRIRATVKLKDEFFTSVCPRSSAHSCGLSATERYPHRKAVAGKRYDCA